LCTIVVSAPGVLTASADLKTSSTLNAGGSPARVRVAANAGGVLPGLACAVNLPLNCFRVRVSALSDFNTKPARLGVPNFTAGWRMAGQDPSRGVTTAVVYNGTHDMLFDLTATLSSGGFIGGTYQADEIVRCE